MKTVTIAEIINRIETEDKVSFTICNEWLVRTNGNKISIQHTYHYKGESFDNLKDGIKYLKTKLNYLVRRGYQLDMERFY